MTSVTCFLSGMKYPPISTGFPCTALNSSRIFCLLSASVLPVARSDPAITCPASGLQASGPSPSSAIANESLQRIRPNAVCQPQALGGNLWNMKNSSSFVQPRAREVLGRHIGLSHLQPDSAALELRGFALELSVNPRTGTTVHPVHRQWFAPLAPKIRPPPPIDREQPTPCPADARQHEHRQ